MLIFLSVGFRVHEYKIIIFLEIQFTVIIIIKIQILMLEKFKYKEPLQKFPKNNFIFSLIISIYIL